MEVVESLAGMLSSLLEFPLVGFLGRLVPGAGSEAGQQVRRARLLLVSRWDLKTLLCTAVPPFTRDVANTDRRICLLFEVYTRCRLLYFKVVGR